MRKFGFAVLCVAAILLTTGLTGCASTYTPVTGTIVELEREPAKPRVCQHKDKRTKSCKRWSASKPACNEVDLLTDDGREVEFCVSDREWRTLTVGQRYTRR